MDITDKFLKKGEFKALLEWIANLLAWSKAVYGSKNRI